MGEMRPTVDRVETGVELALMAVVAAVIAAVMMAHRSNPGEFHRWDLHWHRRLHHHLSLLPRLLLFLLLDHLVLILGRLVVHLLLLHLLFLIVS